MRIGLLDIQTRQTATNKTMAGGYGTSSDYGSSRDPFIWILKNAKRAGVRIPLIELAYLAAILRHKGHDVVVGYGRDIPPADVYLVYVSLIEFNHEMQAIERIRREHPKARIGLVGTMATTMAESLLPRADFVVAGEADQLLYDCAEPVESLSGVLRAPLSDDLDRLPFPEWDGFDMARCVHTPFFGNVPVYPVLASRGCPFACRYYCAYPLVAGGKVRYRSVESLIAELGRLRRRYDAQVVLFRDANFALQRKRTEAICHGMIEAGLNLRWACETHLSRLDRKMADLMHRAGCRAITVGIESRTPEVLKASRRPDCGDEHLFEIVEHCERLGIKIMAGYIFGNLLDTGESIRHTIEFAKKLNTSFAQFTICTPYPGTKFFAEMESRLTTRDWERFDTYTPVFQHPNLSQRQLAELKEAAFREYYFRPQWVITRYLRNKLMDLRDGTVRESA